MPSYRKVRKEIRKPLHWKIHDLISIKKLIVNTRVVILQIEIYMKCFRLKSIFFCSRLHSIYSVFLNIKMSLYLYLLSGS